MPEAGFPVLCRPFSHEGQSEDDLSVVVGVHIVIHRDKHLDFHNPILEFVPITGKLGWGVHSDRVGSPAEINVMGVP